MQLMTCANPNHPRLYACHSSRGLPAVCTSSRTAHQACTGLAVMNLSRYVPVEHPLALQFQQAVDSLTAGLVYDSARQYRGTVRNFLIYLGDHHPAVCALDQLRRHPHILGWFSHLHSRTPPLATAVYISRLMRLRRILEELAWSAQLPDLARLIRRHDAPRPPP